MTRRILYVTAVLALALTLPVTASTFLAMDQHQLVASSDAVVQGKVLQVQSFWNAEGTVIVTEAMIQVADVVAGDAPAIVTVRTFGGEVQGFNVKAEGFPTFSEGQNVLLFLGKAADASLRVTGFQQGFYNVQRGADGVELAVPAMDPNLQLLRLDGSLGERPKTMNLEAFKASIRSQAGAIERGPRAIR